MNTFLTLTILAFALFASCNALGLKDSIDFCNDDEELSATDIAYIKANRLDNPNKDVKSWTWCYYTNLNLFTRFDDASEKLCKAAFISKYPTKYWSGSQIITDCNTKAKDIKGVDEMAWTFHSCLVNNGFKI